MKTTMLIIDLLNKEDKFSLVYLLNGMQSAIYYYESGWSKDELRAKLHNLAIHEPEKFLMYKTYRDAIEKSNPTVYLISGLPDNPVAKKKSICLSYISAEKWGKYFIPTFTPNNIVVR